MNAYNQATAARHRPTPEEMDLATEVFQMLADATRFRLLLALVDDELAVNDLAQVAEKPPTGVSQHLAKLRLARLVATRREGTRVFYRLENDHVRQLIVDVLNHAEHMGPSLPRHHQQQALLFPNTQQEIEFR
ncbi:metalloregulator ArsR/SmtB family transcription factor [Sinomonas sp. JGH33]|uniref:Metalloregulator ArsR/SmtB family transcription factor n=1 Tax=Sinomonas terricola TaxID=3110330 RepID=A0ABU5T619_9MICC|nr:metalloregulator ArsR/SmtB family transcription factor [Sinomonas sp. JGH33]MEA5455113.1 metalloregulator ArsR/SmtB family transcription factor [Sinomonas sp. JGH33]